MSRAIGIDLGTYNSAAAVPIGNGKVAMIESRYGKSLYGKNFASFVLFDHTGQKQITGKRAQAELRLNPKLVIWGVKRLVGLSYQNAKASGELTRFAYETEEGPGGSILIKVGEERYTPSHILEYILRDIKQDAEDPSVNPLVGQPIDKAIISIPAYFKAIRTNPIIEAARNAGFEEVDTIAEPTAAAIDYCMTIEKEANLLAFDIGAGTLDVTVMMVVNEDGNLIPGELCTSGHEALGGLDMDDALVRHMINKYNLHNMAQDPMHKAILSEEIERAKIRLSQKQSTTLDLPGNQTVTFTQGELEEVLAPLLEKCRKPISIALRQAGLRASDLDRVLFIGGPSNMPCIKKVVAKELAELDARDDVIAAIDEYTVRGLPVDPMECVARGASLKAGNIIEPVGKVISEGYGTVFGPIEDAPDYYEPIIRENSHYPISGTTISTHQNPDSLEVPISLVAKRPDTDKSTADHTIYKYEYLGNYSLGITPQRGLPAIEIRLRVTDDKRVVATLIHTQTRQQVKYESLDMLSGQEVMLQEHTPPKMFAQQDMDLLNATVNNKKSGWTREHLEKHMHVAREALALCGSCEDPKVVAAMEKVEAAVARASENRMEKPNEDCPAISNRTKELLDTLLQPGIKQISADEFRRYLEQLIHIAQMVTYDAEN
ncbi:MAG: Hsp70 family protein [Deltaproteobacteria bacterium]|nr:Hsp70 family protein [Deltaproteobacteria bacterium]MBN2674256.1 Hsp70 family protein [Deltaproteobacteria bacterium]